MTRKIDKEKYERILERLAKNENQKSIVLAEKCSYGTISAAKQWDKMGRPTTITTIKNTITNRTKIVVCLPNFWLERLNDDIVAGVWTDYSDAVIDIIRTYFRTRIEDVQVKSPALSKQLVGLREEMMGELNVYAKDRDPTLRKEIMGELKESFSPEQLRKFFRTYIGDDDSILKEREKLRKERKEEFIKEKERIFSLFKDQKPETYVFKNYHGEPLIEEEYDVLIELEKKIGEIPKYEGELTRGDYMIKSTDIKNFKFSYVLLGNHIIMLNLCGKGLTYLPESINQLKFLQNLDLRNNNLTELPESIGKLEFLEELILHDNALKSIPESIGNLKNLGVLHLDNNDLTTLPDTICNLKTWYPIGLTNNKISSLSEKILKYYSYHRELDLVGNPIMETRARNLQDTTLWKIQMKEKKREKLNQK